MAVIYVRSFHLYVGGHTVLYSWRYNTRKQRTFVLVHTNFPNCDRKAYACMEDKWLVENML